MIWINLFIINLFQYFVIIYIIIMIWINLCIAFVSHRILFTSRFV